MNGTIAVILGGGRGTRLFPLTLERAKPAVGFAGKYRLIDIPLSNCINSGIKRVSVLTQFMSASLHRHIMQTYRFDAFSSGFVDVLSAEQTPQQDAWFQGTADAVRATLKHTTYYDYSQMLILSGDHLYRMDYSKLLEHHRETKADISVCVYPVDFDEATRMGLCKIDENGRVEEFVEKPKERNVIEKLAVRPDQFKSKGLSLPEECCMASMGVYVFEPRILYKLLEDPEKTDFGKEVLPAAIHQYNVQAYPFMGYWRDIGTIDAFYEANIDMVQENPPFELYHPSWPFYTHTRSLPPTRVFQSTIRDSLLVEGANITGAHIVKSIIGMRCVVGENSQLREVVMLGADFYEGEQTLSNQRHPAEGLPSLGIGKGCMIERAIIDKNARIGDGVIIRAAGPDTPERSDGSVWVRDGVTIIPKGAIIPSGTVL